MTEREELAAKVGDIFRTHGQGIDATRAVADWVLERERLYHETWRGLLDAACAQRDALQRRLEEGQVAWLELPSPDCTLLVGLLWNETSAYAPQRVRVVKEG